MSIHCVACGRVIQVPAERAGNPRLKIKCGCGTLFALREATIAAAPAQPVSAGPQPARAGVAPMAAARPAPVAAAAAAVPAAQPAAPAAAGPASSPISARPAPAPTPMPPRPEAARVSFQATAAMGAAPAAPTGGGWRRCATHPQVRSASVCTQCFTGFCPECQNKVQNAVVCPKCELLCMNTAEYDERLRLDRQRARPMMEELSTILSYPLRDPLAYVMLAVFTWVFAALGNFAILHGKIVAVLFSQGVLMAYCFSALSRVSSGNLKDFMPDIGDITDLIRTLRLGVTALIAGSGPLLLVMVLIPGVAIMGGMGQAAAQQEVAAQPMPPVFDEDAAPPSGEVEPGSTDGAPGADAAAGLKLLGLAASVIVFGGLGLIWKVVYTPVALTVAGLSRSSLSTLNPVVGFDTIRRMGGTYWQAMGIYTVIAATEWVLGFIFGFIPLLGGLVTSFVDAYAYLMIGCTLGLAVFKKARELELE